MNTIANDVDAFINDKNTFIINDFINECEDSGKFNEDQLYQIRLGFENSLSMGQVKLYANSKFNHYQMSAIRLGFEAGLSMEQVKSYADPKLNIGQMFKIRYSFYNWFNYKKS